MERTLVAVKPDGVKRGLVGEILSRFEHLGLKIVGAKMVWLDEEILQKHYAKDDEWFHKVGERVIENWQKAGHDPEKEEKVTEPSQMGHKVQDWLLEYMKSGPVVAFVLEGQNAAALVRKHVGPTNSVEAPPGTIRGDYYYHNQDLSYGQHSVYNIVHCSGSSKEAEDEIALWFTPEELHEY